MSKEELKVGIIGIGNRGGYAFVDGFHDYTNIKVVAFCDPNPHRMKEASKRLDGEFSHYQEIEEMIKQEQLNAVVVTSPDHCHEENVIRALKCGVHVFVDKPLATTAKGCKNIIDTAKACGQEVEMGFNLRHDPTLLKLKEIISEGTLGRIFLIENREFYDGGRTYMSRWNRKYELSGGLWIHKGSHDFDVFNWLLDFPKPAKVSSMAGIDIFKPDNLPFELKDGIEAGPTCHECHYKTICPDVHEHDSPLWTGEAQKYDGYAKDLCMYTSDKDVHDNGIALVEYENGVKASHLECFATSQTDRLYTVVGSKGQAEISLHNRTILVRPRWSQDTVQYNVAEVKGSHGGADTGIVKNFERILKGEIKSAATLEHGLYSTAIGQAAEISRRENRTVMMDELL